MEEKQDPLYSKHVVEFVAVATEFCKYAEHASTIKGKELLLIFQRLLPLLYMKAAALPETEPYFEEGNEKFVTEFDWHRVNMAFRSRITSADDYLKLPENEENEGPVPASISEDMADIYQDLKNFVLLYQTGTAEIMNDAVWECRMNFDEFWGRKLVSSLGAIHNFLASGDDLAEPSPGTDELDESLNKKDAAFLSRRKQEFRERDGGKLQE